VKTIVVIPVISCTLNVLHKLETNLNSKLTMSYLFYKCFQLVELIPIGLCYNQKDISANNRLRFIIESRATLIFPYQFNLMLSWGQTEKINKKI
jgi:hypothetical protein